ncbi:RNA polymerase sigma factor SigZ [Bellilinea sp.]|uniref:RNA polymerase sigma factor SigZ n=1 Tax=Bellilinea sp. TaxID=2838785 RepID=UPI002ADE0A1B|nr:RNA polymerase sigma factor SigZ [Bellilinea sp.]
MDVQFEQIWEQYRAGLLAFIHKRVDDPMASEDILQDVFLRIYSNLSSLQDVNRLPSWIYQITRNAVVDYYRARRPSLPLPEWVTQTEVEFEESVEKELACCLLPMIEALPDKYRTAIVLSEIEGVPQNQIAQSQKITLSAAKSRVQRGRRLLRKMFEDCCVFNFDVRGQLMAYEPRCDECQEGN